MNASGCCPMWPRQFALRDESLSAMDHMPLPSRRSRSRPNNTPGCVNGYSVLFHALHSLRDCDHDFLHIPSYREPEIIGAVATDPAIVAAISSRPSGDRSSYVGVSV